jgi:hypothetical protein
VTTQRTTDSVSRRTAIAGLAAGGLGLALATTTVAASTQDAATEMAKHPIVGAWNAMTPNGPSLGIFLPNGTAVWANPGSSQDPAIGLVYLSSSIGTWEPVSERGIHFTGITLVSDPNGIFTSTITVDGYPVVSEDGQTLFDDQSQVMITIRDATGAIVQQVAAAGSPPVTGVRMGVGAPGFPAATPEAGTPTP